ncbi:UNVERIFIED_CONTAM: E3 ubiquitin-protein transferase rmnd5a [Gekko kuhli]
MDQCVTVERELEKVLQKFSGYGQLCERSLEELIQYVAGLRREILQSEKQPRKQRQVWRHSQNCMRLMLSGSVFPLS